MLLERFFWWWNGRAVRRIPCKPRMMLIAGIVAFGSMWVPHVPTITAGAATGVTTSKAQATSSAWSTGYYDTAIRGGAVAHDCAPATLPPVSSDPSLTNLFENQIGPGWLGDDGNRGGHRVVAVERLTAGRGDVDIGHGDSLARAATLGVGLAGPERSGWR